jgi:hypothetical protein
MFTPNVLGNYNTYSHNIEVIIGPENISKNIDAKQLIPGQGIVIASTGKTANFYVDKMVMREVPMNSNNSMVTTVSEINIDILEPLGFTFFDKYFSSIFTLGWKLATDAIIFVAVSFNGWFENGSPAPRSFKKTFKCRVTDIKVDVESSAAKYMMKLIPISIGEGLNDVNHIVDRSFRSEIKEKFEDTIKELEKVYNDSGSSRDPKASLGENDRTYEFRVGPNLQRINPKMPVKIEPGATIVQLDPETGKPFYAVTNGTTVSDMLIILGNNIVDIAKELNPKVDDNLEEDVNKPTGTKLMKTFAVHVEAGFSRFDSTKNRYTRVLRYTIDLVVVPELEQQPPNTIGDKKRAMAYMSAGILQKRYDYYFTGQNTEVLDLKIDFNAMYSHMVSSYSQQNAESLAPNIDEETRKAENGLDLIFAKLSNLSKIFGLFGSLFGGFNAPTEKLMEKMPASSILANVLNFTYAPTVVSEFLRSGISVPKDNKHAKNVEQASKVDARANNRSVYEGGPLSSMVKLQLGIRGDPHWIGSTDLNSGILISQSQNYYIGSPKLYLKFNLAEPHDERTGLLPKLGRVNFSGIYTITGVISTFEGSKFTQSLDGTLDTTLLGVQF